MSPPLNLQKQNWTDGLHLRDFEVHKKENEEAVGVRWAGEAH